MRRPVIRGEEEVETEMKKTVGLILLLALTLTSSGQAMARKTEDDQRLAEEILQTFAGSNFSTEFAYLPQAYLLLEEALIAEPGNYKAQGLMAEYLTKAPEFLGNHPKKAIKILENLPPFGNEEQDALTACRLARAYQLDHQTEKAFSTLTDFLARYENNGAVRAELAKLRTEEEKTFQLSFYPILPFNGLMLGGGLTAKYKQFSPKLGCAYDFSHQLFYYELSAGYQFTPATRTELGYYREKNFLHPGYHYWEGWKTKFGYDNGLGGTFKLTLFTGEIGRGDKKKEPLHTRLAALAAANYLYDDWGKDLRYDLGATFGTVEKEDYQIYTLKLPFRYHDYRGLLALGVINQGEAINMHFSNNLVRGYTSDGRKGVKLFLLAFERRIKLFPHSPEPFLGALQGRIFADVGAVYHDRTDFTLQKSVGPGILYNTPLFDICFDLAFTEEGIKPVFQVTEKVL